MASNLKESKLENNLAAQHDEMLEPDMLNDFFKALEFPQ